MIKKGQHVVSTMPEFKGTVRSVETAVLWDMEADAIYRGRGVFFDLNVLSPGDIIEVEVGGVREAHRVVGVLYREGSLLGGERVYASERCLRLMAGDDLIDELEPLSKSAKGSS